MPSITRRGPRCGRARARRGLPVLLGLLLAAGVPGARAAHAQAGHGDGVEPIAAAADSTAAAAGDVAESQRRWGGALFDWSFANVFPWAYNRYVSGQDWARVSPASWSRNLQAELTWDNNSLYANHLAHAYHGAMYHNAGRANGFTFWGSVPFSITGSLVWEYFAEVNPPSANDLITTTAGGVVLGEAAWRAAQLVIDDRASGLDRFWREVAVFAMNPGLGAHRVTRGKAWRVTRGPAPARAPHQSSFDVGYRSLGTGTSVSGGLQQALVRGTLRHGDPYAQEQLRPFDVFDVSFELGSNQPRLLMSVEGSGVLAGGRIGRGVMLGATMEYGLIGNSVYEFSAGSFGLSLRGRTQGTGPWRLGGGLELLASPVAAVPTDFSRDWIQRPYDLSAGVGARATAYVDRGPVQARLSYTAHYLVPLSAAANQHHIQLASAEAKVPLFGPFSVGAGYDVYVQSSRFGRDVGRVTRQHPDVRLFISKAGGDWR